MAATDTLTTRPKSAGAFVLPDTPPREPDEMTSFDSPARNRKLSPYHPTPRKQANHPGIHGQVHSPRPVFGAGRPEKESRPRHSVQSEPRRLRAQQRLHHQRAGQAAGLRAGDSLQEHGAHIDVGQKRDDYALMGIPEYWRFDETGEFHGARLAGDRLVEGRYEPLPIVELSEGVLEGYIEVLDLNIRWERG